MIRQSTLKSNKTIFLLTPTSQWLAFACEDEQTANIMFNVLDQFLKLPLKIKVTFKYTGPVDDFNGIDIIQSK